ncbi:MAG: glycine cleavage system protein GcvH [Candidatus Omnitrophica bacterium]|nr:glycine cleavage system protein GcvH [Candidatus Omnitrophota bacterium]
MNVPQDLRYTKTHEWAKPGSTEIVVGITAHAQEELRDVVYVELPPIGKAVKQAEPTAVVESVKAAFDIYAPVSGTITRVNEALSKSPQLVNQDCYGQGWFFALKPDHPVDVNTLMTFTEYAKLINVEPANE